MAAQLAVTKARRWLGISLLASCFIWVSKGSRRIGSMIGPETHLRMPATNYALLQQAGANTVWLMCHWWFRDLRSVKSQARIDKVRFACQVATANFGIFVIISR